MGRPAILVPLPHALDNDQLQKPLEEVGVARIGVAAGRGANRRIRQESLGGGAVALPDGTTSRRIDIITCRDQP